MQEIKPVQAQDIGYIQFGIAALQEQWRKLLQVGDRIYFRRDRLHAKTAIEIRTDPCVQSIAGQLAHVVYVRSHHIERHFIPAGTVTAVPPWLEKSVERYGSYHAVAFNNTS